MAITEKEIKTLARLARLEFTDGEIEKFKDGFEEIIRFADGINAQIGGDAQTIKEVDGASVAWDGLRPDEVRESLPNEKVTSNVQAENGCFTVRRVVR